MKTENKTPDSIDTLLRWSSKFLESKGFLTPRLDSEMLLCKVLNCRRLDLYLRFDQPLFQKELSDYKTLLIRRLEHEPIAYILGYRDFMNLRFKVNRNVLIPRGETELLVERVLESVDEKKQAKLDILDIGSGSGCIGISLLDQLKESKLLAWDLSEEAVKLSEENALLCGIEKSRFRFEKQDALSETTWKKLGKFDIIVSNPPYIGDRERGELPCSVKEYEPELALFAEENGLAFYRRILDYARFHLHKKGKIFLEIGASQGTVVSDLMTDLGWRNLILHKDYNRLDRILEGTYEERRSDWEGCQTS